MTSILIICLLISNYKCNLYNNNPLEFISNFILNDTQNKLKSTDVFYEPTSGDAEDVCISGDFAYVGLVWGMDIINISNPTDPGSRVFIDINGAAYGIFVSGDYAYIAYQSGLKVVNISNPLTPSVVGSCITPYGGAGWGIYVDGNYAYMADAYGTSSGLAIINVTIPTNPSLLKYIVSTGSNVPWDVYVSGDYAYVAIASGTNKGLEIIDITDPANPGSPIYRTTRNGTNAVYIDGDFAYLACDKELAIINITNPKNPGSPIYKSIMSKGSNNAEDICISGDFCYLATSKGLVVIDISNPTNPGPDIYQELTSPAKGVYICGEYAYIANYDDGLAVIKIGEIIDPQSAHSTTLTGAGQGIFISGDYAYIADYDSGLAVVNITDPSNPGPSYYESISGDAYELFISGDYAYVGSTSGLSIINITNPKDPGSPYFISTTGAVNDVFIDGDYAYLAESGGFRVINNTDPQTATSVAYIGVSGSPQGIYVCGDFAFLATWSEGLKVVNITDPTNPAVIAGASTSGICYKIFVSGDYAYLANSGGLVIIDIKDPKNPGIPIYKSFSVAYDVFISGNYAYIACFNYYLAVINITVPTSPGDPVILNVGRSPRGIYISGDYAFLAGAPAAPGGWISTSQIMIPWYALPSPISNTITPNPDNDGAIILDWDNVSGAVQYYIYRDSSSITTMTGKTPYVTVLNSYCQDNITIDGTYYYVIVAANGRGKSWISNCESVLVDMIAPNNFSIYSPTSWVNNVTPTVIGKFFTNGSGIDISTVQYAFSKSGSLIPENWASVNGVYKDSNCSNLASDGDKGWIYAKVNAVSFDEESGTKNTIRFRANDTAGNQGTQSSTTIIQIDLTAPGNFSIYSPTSWVTNQTPTVIGMFYTGLSGVNIATVQYAYSTDGSPNPTNWTAVDGVYTDSSCTTLASNGSTGWLYARVLVVPFNQDSSTLNRIRFRAMDMASNQGTQQTATIIPIDSTAPLTPPFTNLNNQELNNIYLATLIGAIAAAVFASARIYKLRSGRKGAPKIKLALKAKKDLQLKSVFSEKMTIEEKIQFLDRNEIPINMVPELKDAKLNEYVQQNFAKVPQEIKEKIMKLNIPMEEKVEILEEFKSLPEELQKEFLKELDEN